MAAINESEDRRVVPRWHSFNDALAADEISPVVSAKLPAFHGKEFLHEKELAWRVNRSLVFAVDLVSAATVFGSTELAQQAAEFILEAGSKVSSLAEKLAKNILGFPSPSIGKYRSFYGRSDLLVAVKQLKHYRLSQPRNAFVWLDLARLYVLLGQAVSAEKALRIALSLAPYERFIVRSAARFFLHNHDPEQALTLLRSSPRTSSDPWLVSAEVAISSVLHKKPKFAKQGFDMLSRQNTLPFHTSELASALGSLEMFSGNRRRANKLFEQSLRQPTENALAQVVWASSRTGLEIVDTSKLQRLRAHEAMAFNAFNHEQWGELLGYAEQWATEESFSSRPRMLAASIATSLLDQPQRGEEIARAGLSSNPGHPGLLNNVAFALVNQGRPADALREIQKVDKSQTTPYHAVCLLATTGLAYFRLGITEEGLRYYEIAIETAKKEQLDQLKTLATLYLSRENIRLGDSNAVKVFQKAAEEAKRYPNSTIPPIARHLSNEILNWQKDVK